MRRNNVSAWPAVSRAGRASIVIWRSSLSPGLLHGGIDVGISNYLAPRDFEPPLPHMLNPEPVAGLGSLRV